MVSEINQINTDWLDSNRNIENEQRFIDWYGDFTKDLSGTSRTLEVIGKVARIGNELRPTETLQRIQEGAGTALTSFGLVRIPLTTKDALQSIYALVENDGLGLNRKISIAAKAVMQMLAAWASAIFLLTAFAPLRLITNSAFLGAEVTDFSHSLSDYSKASELSKTANGAIKEAVDHSRNYYFYRALKNTAGVANGAIALIALAFDVTLLPAIGLAFLSLGVTLLAMKRDFCRDSGTYSVIDFKRPVAIQ